jgi:glycosyltransferase involved in cell wall biosynthesis
MISIILPVFNTEKYLLECLQSIKNQTYTNWELIIINDGSTDNSHQIITNFIQTILNKVQYFHLEQNQGLPYCLNLGIHHAKSTYIARIDADDIMLPERLKEQIFFLKTHPNIGVVGAYAIDINEKSERMQIRTKPTDNQAIKHLLFKDCPFIHPSILMRKSILEYASYRNKYPFAEDYDLWIRLADKTEFANIPIPLIYKRMHPNQITASKRGNYDWLKIKWNYYLQTKTLFKNHWYLWRHLFILLTPTPLFLFLKKRKHEKRKKAANALRPK